MSKRKLRLIVEQGFVDGWADPRMPTLAGMRRRGYPPEAILEFIATVGIAKNESFVDIELLEHIVRDELNLSSKRRMAVLQPLKLIIDNYPEGKTEMFDVKDFPQDPESMSTRPVSFSRELWIERDDFMEEPVPKYHRLSPGKEVRLMNAYFVRAVGLEKGPDGELLAVHCTYDPETRGGNAADGRKVKGTIHWVDSKTALDAEVHLYEQLFPDAYPEDLPEGEVFTQHINRDSKLVIGNAKLEASLADQKPGEVYQFVRNGYFTPDSAIDQDGKPTWLRTIGLVDTWAKMQK